MAQRKLAFHVFGSGRSTPGWYFPARKQKQKTHKINSVLIYYFKWPKSKKKTSPFKELFMTVFYMEFARTLFYITKVIITNEFDDS